MHTACAARRALLRRGWRAVPLFSCASVPPGAGRPGRPPQQPSSALPTPPLRASRRDGSLPPYVHTAGGAASSPGAQSAARRGPSAARGLATAVAAAAAVVPAGGTALDSNASYSASDGLRLVSAVHYLPHPDKRATGGEDASFIGADGLSAGVADGVGGWADQGVDAGVYARLLMSHANKAAALVQPEPVKEEPAAPATPGREEDTIDSAPEAVRAYALAPLRVLLAAHSATRVPGSSTALVLLLRNSTLHTANLGDSGFLILRDGRQVFKTQPQQHQFNFPYQIGAGPSDPPTAAQLYALAVERGDVIVAATDGLWDNLHDAEIAAIVRSELAAGHGPEGAAKRCAEAAHVRGADPRADTPFARGAYAAGIVYRGGKMDDCTVLVSIVQ